MVDESQNGGDSPYARDHKPSSSRGERRVMQEMKVNRGYADEPCWMKEVKVLLHQVFAKLLDSTSSFINTTNGTRIKITPELLYGWEELKLDRVAFGPISISVLTLEKEVSVYNMGVLVDM
ncbi:hypothetical protein ACSQ67_020878 [Phaseolus vulgaris]